MRYVVKTSRGNYVGAGAQVGDQIDIPALTDDQTAAAQFVSASDALTFGHALVNERPARDGLTRRQLYIVPIEVRTTFVEGEPI